VLPEQCAVVGPVDRFLAHLSAVDWSPQTVRSYVFDLRGLFAFLLQYALNLPDRQAAEAVRCRIDFKYAVGLELEDPGFHHSVLSDFRARLAEGDRADRPLGLALTRIRRSACSRGAPSAPLDHFHRH
jgi:hypothetical protein